MPRSTHALPLVLPGLCFIAFPIALSHLMNQDEYPRLALACLAADCWMIVVLLGLRAILLPGFARDVHASMRIGFSELLQLVLFVAGLPLMILAIKF